jgi:hypothetical protein
MKMRCIPRTKRHDVGRIIGTAWQPCLGLKLRAFGNQVHNGLHDLGFDPPMYHGSPIRNQVLYVMDRRFPN